MPEKTIRRFTHLTSRRIALPVLLTIALFLIAIFYVFLPQIEQSFISQKKEKIQDLTETVWSLLGSYRERELSGELTGAEAQRRAVLRIGKLRYGKEQKDYFWITDMEPRVIMHPYRPDLVNRDVKDIKDEYIRDTYARIKELGRTKDAGFIDYTWQWKDVSGKMSAKQSYLKVFKPWGWIVGTGLYLDDIHREMATIRHRIMVLSIGILGGVLMLSAYSIRQTLKADKALLKTFRERRNLMESLKESNDRFRSLLENTSDWIWESDRNGRYTYSSPRVENLIGFSAEETVDKTIVDFVRPDMAEPCRESYRQLLDAGKPFKGFEVTCLGKNGQTVVLENNAVPVFQGDGDLLGYRGVTRDITDRKRAMEALEESRDSLHENLEETVMSLASAEEKRDPYTAGHQARVDRLACAIAREMGLPEDQIEGLHFAALLHDIGKIALPSEFLSKPTRLSVQEHEIIKCHPAIGYDILKNIHFPWPVAEIVYQHHEHLDGTGYPRQLTDEHILLEAKILTVADVVEAMSSHRPYRPSMGLEASLEEIRNGRGTRYHAPSVDACLKLMENGGLDLIADNAPRIHA